MSLSVHTLKRLRTIKKGLLDGLSRDQIGDMCKVTEKTIDRDMMSWFESGLFETWIKEEWLRHHLIVSKKDPIETYKQLTKLLGHTLTRKMKLEEKIDITEHIEVVKIDVTKTEDEILSEAVAILTRKAKSAKIH